MREAGSWMPRYVITCLFHLNRKFDWHCWQVSNGKVTLRALDFVKLICRLVRALKVLKSLNKFRIVISGSVRKSKMSSAKAACL